MGDKFSAADACAFTILKWSKGLKIDLSPLAEHQGVLRTRRQAPEDPGNDEGGGVGLTEAGGSPAAGYFSCAAKKSNQKKAAPGVAPLVRGAPVLPASMWRLRNSTWRGAHNAPHCGTRTVLVDFPSSSRAARRATRGAKASAAGMAGFDT